jgi:hypothetical protein
VTVAGRFSVSPKWWWNPDENVWERAGFVVECEFGDLERVVPSEVDARAAMVVHVVDCVQQRLFG